jgi:hypothetical protein
VHKELVRRFVRKIIRNLKDFVRSSIEDKMFIKKYKMFIRISKEVLKNDCKKFIRGSLE